MFGSEKNIGISQNNSGPEKVMGPKIVKGQYVFESMSHRVTKSQSH